MPLSKTMMPQAPIGGTWLKQYAQQNKKHKRFKETKENLKEYSAQLEIVLAKVRTTLIEFEIEHDVLSKNYAKEVKRGQKFSGALREIKQLLLKLTDEKETTNSKEKPLCNNCRYLPQIEALANILNQTVIKANSGAKGSGSRGLQQDISKRLGEDT